MLQRDSEGQFSTRDLAHVQSRHLGPSSIRIHTIVKEFVSQDEGREERATRAEDRRIGGELGEEILTRFGTRRWVPGVAELLSERERGYRQSIPGDIATRKSARGTYRQIPLGTLERPTRALATTQNLADKSSKGDESRS